jgi:hypothetical protein
VIYCVVVGVGIAMGRIGAGAGIPFLLGMMIIPGYILYLLLSPKGSMVFSPEYWEAIERTPHIKYKTSWLLKGCLILFILSDPLRHPGGALRRPAMTDPARPCWRRMGRDLAQAVRLARERHSSMVL